MNALAYGITIIVEENNKTYHTLDDWGYAIGNNNYIGDPEMETTYIKVPGRNGYIDASEAISGRRIYKSRALSFNLGGIEPRLAWDGIISSLRNDVDGRICRLILDNDRGYYWRGRVYVRGFDRNRDLGQFVLDVPMADPYKYDVNSSAEPWLWDPFNFETGVITQTGAEVISGSGTVTIQHGHMLTCPQLVVSDLVSPTFTVTYDGATFPLVVGTNIIPSILVGGEDDVTLSFLGSATVQVVYRGGSL